MPQHYSTKIINDLGIVSCPEMTQAIRVGLLSECVRNLDEWMHYLPRVAPALVDSLAPRGARDLRFEPTELLIACAVTLAHEAALAELKQNFCDAWNQLEELLALLGELQRRKGRKYKKYCKDSSSEKKRTKSKKNHS